MIVKNYNYKCYNNNFNYYNNKILWYNNLRCYNKVCKINIINLKCNME